MSRTSDKPVTRYQLEETIAYSVVKLVEYYLQNIPVELKNEYKNATYYYRWYQGSYSQDGEQIHKPFFKGGIIDRVTREWKLSVSAADNLTCLSLLEAELINEINRNSILKGVQNV